jgi:LysR family glycine cleavage system transcriptional activator
VRRQIPSLHALLCFEAAGRTESFARAAEALNLTQSTLSRHIQSLEGQLRQTLFERSRQRVRLTSAGRQLLSELSQQLAELEATILRTRSITGQDGAVNIGVYPTLGARWLIPNLLGFGAKKTTPHFNTITYLRNDEIDSNLVDLGIAQGDPPFPGFEETFLMPETLVVAASPELIAKPLADPFDLLDHRILLHVTRRQSWQIWFNACGLTLNELPIGPTFSQFEMLIDAVRRGYGIAILPKLLISKELASGELVLAHELQATPSSSYYIVIPTAKVGAARILRMKRLLTSLASQSED